MLRMARGRWMSPDPAMESEILEVPQTWNRHSYVYNRPTYGTDPDGRCPPCVGALVGGIVGGVVEGGWNLGSQLIFNGGQLTGKDGVDWGAVGANAAGGFVTGAIAGSTGGLGLLGDALVGAGANVAGGLVTRGIGGEETSAGDVATDALAGYVGGSGGHVAADLVYVPEVGPRPKAYNNKAAVRRMATYNANVTRRGLIKGGQTAVGTAAGSPPTHGMLGLFWLFTPIPPPPPPAAPCATTSATDSAATPQVHLPANKNRIVTAIESGLEPGSLLKAEASAS